MKGPGASPSFKGRRSLKSQPLPRLSFTRLLLDITFMRILLTLLSPFRSIVAWQLFCGRSVLNFAVAIERALLRTAGWLSAPPKSRALRQLLFSAIDVRRWHLAAGMAPHV